MTELFLYSFLGLCILLVLKVISNPKLIYEYPYFTGFIFLIFIAPQTIIVYNQPHLVPNNTLLSLNVVSFLCLVMAVIGYRMAPSLKLDKSLGVLLNRKKVINIAILYTLLGYLFIFLIHRQLSELGEVETQWSGSLTIYVQLMHFINIAFPLFLYVTLEKFTIKTLVFSAIAGLPSMYFIVVSGRREITAMFVLTLALTFFFRKNIVPSRYLVAGAIVFAALIIPATGTYRQLAEEKGPLEAVQTIDLRQGFVDYYNSGKLLELSVAAHIIDSYSFHGEYAYGAGYWDYMVFRYVPGQIVGRDLKESLMINPGGVKYRNGYKPYPGLTATAVGDTFMQLGFLGSIFFFFLGGFFRELWKSSYEKSQPLVQILYIMSMVQALLSVTHQTINFLPGIFFSFICLWLVARYAKAAAQ